MIVIQKPNLWKRVAIALVVAVTGVGIAASALANGANAQVSGTNGRILYASGTGNVGSTFHLWTSNPDGSDPVDLTPGGNATEGAWSPDGARIAFSGTVDGETGIHIINADGTGRTLVVPFISPASLTAPNWSPDGGKLVYAKANGANSLDIYTINTDGTVEALVSSSINVDTAPSWSPDGTKIAFVSFPVPVTGVPTLTQLRTVNPDGTSAQTIFVKTLFTPVPASTDWHPDSQTVLWANGTAVESVDRNLAGPVTGFASPGRSAEWSPDATQIILSLPTGASENDIAILNPDGTTSQQLIKPGTNEVNPSWQPVNEPPDTTAPQITVTTPAEGAEYIQGAVVLADYACADEVGGSGLATCDGTVPNGSAIDTASLGAKTFAVNATDVAGNSASKVVNYEVVAPPVVFPFSGFKAPVDNLPTVNSVNSGRTVPVKFSLGGDRGLGIFAAGYPRSELIACGSSDVVDGIEETSTANDGLIYDAVSDTYTYAWKTEKAWSGTCRQLVLQLTDGSVHRANFKFTK